MSDVKEIIEKAQSSEAYFMTLRPEVRLQVLAALVVQRIQADIDNGLPLLNKLKDTYERDSQ